MPVLPTGTVTFLFTDIEGSTALLQRLGDARYANVLAEHCRLLRHAITASGGQEISTHGDAILAVFHRAKDAVAASVAAQLEIAAYPWPDGASVRVRMGLHTGEPVDSEAGYVGLDVNRATRICSAAHGGQILLSEATQSLVAHDLAQGLQLRDLSAHRLKDLRQPERIFQLLHPELPWDFPSLKSLSIRPNNLPIQLTSFVGREKEMTEFRCRMATTRLLTLTGSGGCGKTRLALQVAADLLDDFVDGVWFVEFAALSDPALVPETIASALKLREQLVRPWGETLSEYLRPKSLLLVLDNCEHLVAACAKVLEDLLKTCPSLRVLVTSREALNIAGESVFRVPSLSHPDPGTTLSPHDISRYEAVRLFVDRAMLARPGFTLTDRDAAALARVCQRLDGNPLAIELAAARTKVLSIEQIAARLDDRFRLLSGGSRTALPRQQTLRAAMDWSYDLLSEKDRALLRRLAVFLGGWTLEAAEGVCTGDGVDTQEILDLLESLADKSLIVVGGHDNRMRYRQLETVRQYGLERLLESGEAAAVRKRHLDWYVVLAERAAAELVGAEQAEWLDRLETEHDNLRTALHCALAGGHIETGLRLATAAGRFWFVRGYAEEGRGWLEALLKMRGGAPTVRAKALSVAGNLACFGQGDYTSGRAFLEESLSQWRALGNDKGIADLLNSLGLVARNLGDLAAARDLHEDSLAIRREVGDALGVAGSLHNLGMVAYLEGDYDAARTLLEESLSLCRTLEHRQHVATTLTSLGLVATRQGDYELGRARYREGLAIRRDVGDKSTIAYSLDGLAEIAARSGLAERAAELLGAADALREAIRAPLPPVLRADYDRIVAATRSTLSEECFAAAWARGRAMTLEQAVGSALRRGNLDRHAQQPV